LAGRALSYSHDRLPAEELEQGVLAALNSFLSDRSRVSKAVGQREPDSARHALDRAAELAGGDIQKLSEREAVIAIVTKIVVGPNTLSLVISQDGLCVVLGIPPLEATKWTRD
jgi:hypothetical protein